MLMHPVSVNLMALPTRLSGTWAGQKVIAELDWNALK